MNRLRVCIVLFAFAVIAARAEETNTPAPAGVTSNAMAAATMRQRAHDYVTGVITNGETELQARQAYEATIRAAYPNVDTGAVPGEEMQKADRAYQDAARARQEENEMREMKEQLRHLQREIDEMKRAITSQSGVLFAPDP
jgi:hypothetical protein